MLSRKIFPASELYAHFQKAINEKERFGDKNGELTRINFRVGSLSALLNPMTFAVMNLAIVILLYFGGKKRIFRRAFTGKK